MNLIWMGRNRSLELSPRARLVDDVEAAVLRAKRESLQWRPRNGFLLDASSTAAENDANDRAA